MKLVFNWQECDPGAAAFGVEADHLTYEAEIPESFIPKQVLTAIKQGFKPRVLLVSEGDIASRMTYLSVCSGIEAVSVAWEPLGFTSVGFAETKPHQGA